MSDILLHLLPAIASCLIYALMGWHFWQTRWQTRRHTRAPLQSSGGDGADQVFAMSTWERLAILIALALHAIALYDGLFGGGGMRFSFSFAASLMLWLAVLIYWLESFRSRMDGLQPMVLPLAAACSLLPVLFPQVRVIDYAHAWGFKLHFLMAMLAYSLFTLSALHAVLMGFVERQLRHRQLNAGLAQLPPLLAMEALLFRMITVGFFLLTGALASGILFSESIFGKAMAFDHKTIFAFASWLIFAALLFGRRVYGWRGRIALRWTIAGFIALLLAYIGSHFVSEVLLGRL